MSVQDRLEQARYAVRRCISQRRACTLLSVARSDLDYQRKMTVKDQPIVAAMRQYSEQYTLYGARRIRIFLGRDGLILGRDRAARIWAGAGLEVPAKMTRKRYRSQNRQLHVATGPNKVWAYNFVFDACANGQKLMCLTLIDEFTKKSLCIDVAESIKDKRVVLVLEEVIAQRGHHKVLRSENGPEFVSTILLEWAEERGLHNLHIEPGKPWQNATNKSFNGKFRYECLAMNWFHSRQHAKVIIEVWRKHYNLIRPDSSLDNRTLTEFGSGWQKELITGARVSR